MLTQYFHTDSCTFCKSFEGLFGGVKLWRIDWNSPNSPTFSPAKFCAIWYSDNVQMGSDGWKDAATGKVFHLVTTGSSSILP